MAEGALTVVAKWLHPSHSCWQPGWVKLQLLRLVSLAKTVLGLEQLVFAYDILSEACFLLRNASAVSSRLEAYHGWQAVVWAHR